MIEPARTGSLWMGRSRQVCRAGICHTWALGMFCLLVSSLLAQGATPVKLEVLRSEASIQLGDRTAVTVRLLDAENHRVRAPKDLPIENDARLPSNQVQTLARTMLKAGENTVTVPLPAATTEGFLYIWAKQPELLPGGAYLRVRARRSNVPDMERGQAPGITVPAPANLPKAVAPPQVAQERGNTIRRTRIPIGMTAPLPAEISRGASVSPALTPPVPAPPAPTKDSTPSSVTSALHYDLALRYSPQRTFLANGKDAVTVHAFVFGKGDNTDLPGFRINLFDGSNTLAPRPLQIPPGAEEGTATLTYDHVGTIKVEYVAANPPVDIDGDREMLIHFDPPITGIDITGNSSISFIDTTDIVITTVGDAQQPIATDESRTVSLALTSGSGNLSQSQVTIASQTSDSRLSFTPLWWGTAVISASTPSLLTKSLSVSVEVPWMLLALSITGGLAGGWVFVRSNPSSETWRIPAGALTGFILLWSALYLGRAGLPRAVVLNPFSIFAISVVGGWLGTAVFKPLAEKFGP